MSLDVPSFNRLVPCVPQSSRKQPRFPYGLASHRHLDLPGLTAAVNGFLGKIRIEILAASHEPVAAIPEPRD